MIVKSGKKQESQGHFCPLFSCCISQGFSIYVLSVHQQIQERYRFIGVLFLQTSLFALLGAGGFALLVRTPVRIKNTLFLPCDYLFMFLAFNKGRWEYPPGS
jgi:hypothetical protein